MRKIRRNDEVVVLKGRDRGKRGRVNRVLPDGRLLVANINMVKRHTKPNPSQNRPGGVIEKEAPIDASNAAIFNPAAERADRVKFAPGKDGKLRRVFKSDGNAIG